MSRQTVIYARHIIPVRPARTVLQDHAVVIDGEQIVDLLPSSLARIRYPAVPAVHLDHHVLMPGLINMHTHAPMTLLRGYADDLELGAWLNDHIWPLERKFVTPEFIADGAKLAIAEMLRGGTTCFNDLYFYPEVTADIASQAGIRACIGLPVFEMATAWATHVDEYFEKGIALLERNSGQPLISFSIAPHAPYSVTDKTLERAAEVSRGYSIPVHLHLLETESEIRQSLDVHGRRPLQRLDDLHLLTSDLIAVHMTQISPADIELLAERTVHVIHCPQSNLKLASGMCPVAALLAASVNVALGTDGAASNNNLDMLSEAQTAALLAKGLSADPTSLDAFTALEMLTINGARALHMDQSIGSIEIGKQADLAALDLHAPETQPSHNVVSLLIYAASSRQFTDVWVAGKILLKSGVLTTLDLSPILGAAESWRIRLAVRS